MDKKYLVNVLIYLITGVLALSLIVFVIYHLADFDESSFTTAVAYATEAQNRFEGDGWIFKNETVLEPEQTGTVYSPLSDGENVAAGAEVCAVYDENKGTLFELNELDRLIAVLEDANAGGNLYDCTAKVRALSAEMRKNANGGDCSAMLEQYSALETALDRRSTASGAVSNFDKEIARLKERRAALLENLGEKKETLTADFAGNYYKTCDGYEQIFTFSAAETLGPIEFEALVADPGEPETHSAGKLAQGTTWKLLIVTDTENTVLLAAGKTYTIVFSEDHSVQMQLERIATDPTTGQTLLGFYSRVRPTKALDRCEHIAVVTETQAGLRVPAAALRCPEEEGGQIGVYVQSGNRISFKKVEILTRQNGFYVVKAFPKNDKDHAGYLQENDIVLTSGKELTEGYAP